MKTKAEIVENWLPRYTQHPLSDFGEYILLTLSLIHIWHYQSEQYTKEIFYSIIGEICPELPLYMTAVDTNPIKYL